MTIAPLVLSLVLTPVSARAQGVPFAAVPFQAPLSQLRLAVLPDLDELLAHLKDGTDRKGQLEALEAIAFAAGRLRSDEQMRVVWALRDASLSGFTAPEVRGKSLDALGKSAAWFHDASAVREAVLVLCEAALVDNPNDGRYGLRIYALSGLSKVAGRLPWGIDRPTEETVARTALEALREARTAQEKTLSLMTLDAYLRSRGAAALYQSPDLASRVEQELLSPLEGNLDRTFTDPNITSDARYLLARCLNRIGWTNRADPMILHRVGQIFRNWSVSPLESNHWVKEAVRVYAARIKA